MTEQIPTPEPAPEPAPGEYTDQQITDLFAAIIAPLAPSMPPVPDRLTDPENLRKLTGMAHRNALREVESLRRQLAEVEADRDQLRQAVEDLDEQVEKLTMMLTKFRAAWRSRKAQS